MTDSEKLDLLLEKVTGINEKVNALDEKITVLEKDIVDVKADLRRLQRDADFILDEVERVHGILDEHKADKAVHTA
ncbi:MAG: hypothetical protein HFG34_12980 [Eubacterium sp.]|nr:hypothetical protein [Eubacterium sp.]